MFSKQEYWVQINRANESVLAKLSTNSFTHLNLDTYNPSTGLVTFSKNQKLHNTRTPFAYLCCLCISCVQFGSRQSQKKIYLLRKLMQKLAGWMRSSLRRHSSAVH